MDAAAVYEFDDRVAILTVGNGPLNARSPALLATLNEAFGRAEAEPGVHGIVLATLGPAQPRDTGLISVPEPGGTAAMSELCDRIEASGKPVAFAVEGMAAGGGFQLALAAQYRLAAADASFACPEILLGQVPGAGATLRLPRLTGAGPALDLLLGGEALAAEAAVRQGLIDGIARGPAAGFAAAFLRQLADAGAGPRPTRHRTEGFSDAPGYLAQVRAKRAQVARHPVPAAAAIVDCVEAALLMDWESGLAMQDAARQDCGAGPETSALRHVALAEQRAATPVDAGVEAAPVARVGVAGGDAHSCGVAVAMLDAGLEVEVAAEGAAALEAAIDRIDGIYGDAIAAGRLSAEARDRLFERLSGTPDMAALADADLVYLGAGTLGHVAALGQVAAPVTILALAAAGGAFDALSEASGCPEQVIGVDFPSPGTAASLVEIIAGQRTSAEVVTSAVHMVRAMGRLAVASRALPGPATAGIGQRMRAAGQAAADALLVLGATPYAIDRALRDHGFDRGPFEMRDASGIIARSDAPAGRLDADAALLAEGRTGRAGGQGYYRYRVADGTGEEDPEVPALIDRHRQALGLVDRRLPAGEIRQRYTSALAAAGARLLSAGVAARPADIDLVMVLAQGFPRWRGGPMKAADLDGLPRLEHDLALWSEDDDAVWSVDPLIDELRKNGRDFGWLDGR